MNRLVSLCLVLLIISSVSVPTVAQNSDTETDSEEILRIVQNERIGEIEKVEQWLNNVNGSEYPSLYPQAQEWVNSVNEENEDLTEKYSGYVNVSKNVDVEGYEFDRDNETVKFVLEVDELTTLAIDDVGKYVSNEQSRYDVRTLSAGTYELNYSAKEVKIDGVLTQVVSITDSSENIRASIRRSQDTLSLFDKLKWWMIPLSAITGSGTVFGLSIRYIRNKEDWGVDELIPLKGGDNND